MARKVRLQASDYDKATANSGAQLTKVAPDQGNAKAGTTTLIFVPNAIQVDKLFERLLRAVVTKP